MARKYKVAPQGSKGGLTAKCGAHSSTIGRRVKNIPTFEKQVEKQGRGRGEVCDERLFQKLKTNH
jgi:hypothetical protein